MVRLPKVSNFVPLAPVRLSKEWVSFDNNASGTTLSSIIDTGDPESTGV